MKPHLCQIYNVSVKPLSLKSDQLATREYTIYHFHLKSILANFTIDHHTQEVATFSHIFSIVFCYKHRERLFYFTLTLLVWIQFLWNIEVQV